MGTSIHPHTHTHTHIYQAHTHTHTHTDIKQGLSKDSPLKVLKSAGAGLVGTLGLVLVTIVAPEAHRITEIVGGFTAHHLHNIPQVNLHTRYTYRRPTQNRSDWKWIHCTSSSRHSHTKTTRGPPIITVIAAGFTARLRCNIHTLKLQEATTQLALGCQSPEGFSQSENITWVLQPIRKHHHQYSMQKNNNHWVPVMLSSQATAQ